jgi:hypothetical protein
MPNYTKLFNSIVTSTIWTEDDKTRIVWITMLALSDQNGEVHSSIPGLARLAGVSIPDAEKAIAKFLSPDDYSRTPDNEGRRIATIDGGWELLNHAKYRRMASLADKKESTANRQRRFRDRNATVTHRNATVTHRNATVTLETYKAEAEAEAEADNKERSRALYSGAASAALPDIKEIMPTGAAADMLALQSRIQAVKPAWKLALTYEEQQSMMRNAACLASLADEDWKRISEYLAAKLPEGEAGWQPRSRGKFIETLPDVHDHACRWEQKSGNAPKRKGWT